MTGSQTITNEVLLEEIRLVNNSLRNTIEASEARVLLKLEESNKIVEELETEVARLNHEIELLNKNQRKNNILIFGLPIPENCYNISEYVLAIINGKLETDIAVSDLNNIYVLNHVDSKPIKVEFISYLRKSILMKNCFKLKNTNIAIANDQTAIERQEGALLRKHLKLAKQEEPNKTCKIRKGALYVGTKKYTIQHLKNIEEQSDTEERSFHSAPPTPTLTIPTSNKELPNFLQLQTNKRSLIIGGALKNNSPRTPEEDNPTIKNNTPKNLLTKDKTVLSSSNYRLRKK